MGASEPRPEDVLALIDALRAGEAQAVTSVLEGLPPLPWARAIRGLLSFDSPDRAPAALYVLAFYCSWRSIAAREFPRGRREWEKLHNEAVAGLTVQRRRGPRSVRLARHQALHLRFCFNEIRTQLRARPTPSPDAIGAIFARFFDGWKPGRGDLAAIQKEAADPRERAWPEVRAALAKWADLSTSELQHQAMDIRDPFATRSLKQRSPQALAFVDRLMAPPKIRHK